MSELERSRSAPSSDAAQAHLTATLLAVAGEDRDAFKELYRLTNAKLFGICLRICGNHANAEDVLHEVYLLIWRRAGAWQPGRASPISWLAVIARNRSIDWLRAQTSRPAASLNEVPDILDWQPDAETILIARGEYIRLVECLSKLDPRQRYAIATAFFGGATYAEVAARAGVPTSTAKSWIRRGLQQLQNCLGVD
ncbi:sigma-70 family RNA polymerase sigma factor [Sphingomonas sp. PAMC26645]|uniref:sigma-70 family RNA polymerase sigma factor n=1 Tax=Sphingomonas sp. PAMC26645 TaxID=2565555 RepID=UPI00109DE9B4|nr:sigma-70 family RNA polymerase sigma factor [Sphingomonas sp. PAMC26645]QCB43260.1 sigma-70 family RNA polymerase sigma factor [Sphingomonas sp. PAMC26645]